MERDGYCANVPDRVKTPRFFCKSLIKYFSPNGATRKSESQNSCLNERDCVKAQEGRNYSVNFQALTKRHGGGLYRAAPGLTANRQAAYGRDPDAVFLAHRKRDSGDEPGPRGQDSEVFAHTSQKQILW